MVLKDVRLRGRTQIMVAAATLLSRPFTALHEVALEQELKAIFNAITY